MLGSNIEMWKVVIGVGAGAAAATMCLRPTRDILREAQASLIRIQYTNRETFEPENYSTGFLISPAGVAITSGLNVSAYKNSKAVIKLQDGREFEAEQVVFPTAPGLGFLTLKGVEEELKFVKPVMKSEGLKAGDKVYAIGMRGPHLFFTELYVTDTNYRSAFKEDTTITIMDAVRTTGQVPDLCVGGPLLDSDGRAVAVLVNVEMNTGIGAALSYMEKFKDEEEAGWVQKSYRRFKEGVYRMLEGFSR